MTRPLWTADEAAQATKGRIEGAGWTADGVSIDSRTVAPGDLFVAIAGPNHDGHDHVADALARGAAAAMVARKPEGLAEDAPLLLVADSLAGLTALAAAARTRSRAKVIAVTGSVGKTGTKEMLALALGAVGPTHVSQGNLNNHWGVPLSLARLPASSAFAVFELGMNHPGEITPLTRLVRPDVAVITSVEAVHMAHFPSTRAIAEAKAEILNGLREGGTIILPRDNPHYDFLREQAVDKVGVKIETFGRHIDARARLLDCAIEVNETLVLALVGDAAISYRVGAAGAQWATNSLAVLLAATAVGAALETVTPALAAMTAPKGRGARTTLTWGEGSIEVIDESYNASPVAMRAALTTLGAARLPKGARKIAVLGDMLELGKGAAAMHQALAEPIVESGIDLVFTAGPLMRSLYETLPLARRGGHAADSADAASQVCRAVRPGDVVMVKGSAGSRMGLVVKALEETAALPLSANSSAS